MVDIPHGVKPPGRWPHSVAIIGAAGLVGSGVLHELATNGIARRILATDPNDGRLQAHLLDIRESVVAGDGPDIQIAAAAPDDLPAVDLTIVAAALPETPNGDRRRFLRSNWELLRGLTPTLERTAAAHGVVLLLTNPVDVLAECLRRTTTLDPGQILGYSYNDSVRLRIAAARELGIVAKRVEAWVLGEHGDGQVPLLSRVRVDGEPIELASAAQDRVRTDVLGWFARWSALEPGRSSGWTTSRGVRVMVDAMRRRALLPSSVATANSPYELPDAYLTLPTVLDTGGCAEVEPWPLNDLEHAQLVAAARRVRSTADQVVNQEVPR